MLSTEIHILDPSNEDLLCPGSGINGRIQQAEEGASAAREEVNGQSDGQLNVEAVMRSVNLTSSPEGGIISYAQ